MGKRWLWWLVFAALLVLSVDFWNWNDGRIVWFMPLWTWHILVLVLVLSGVFALFAKYGWRDE